MAAIIGGFFLFCIVGTLVWMLLKAVGIGIVIGVGIIISAVVVAAFVIKDKFA